MTPEDVRYIKEHFVDMKILAKAKNVSDAEIGVLRDGDCLPQPTHVLQNGEQMVPKDYFDLYLRAGRGIFVKAAFIESFLAAQESFGEPRSPELAEAEWEEYLTGVYGVCLRSVTPRSIVRKSHLMKQIEVLLNAPSESDDAWRTRLKSLVDELDAIEMPFCDADRVRAGRPLSRDTHVTEVRKRYFPETLGTETASEMKRRSHGATEDSSEGECVSNA